jgi:hypothetical protein
MRREREQTKRADRKYRNHTETKDRDKRQETRDKRQETRDKRQETRDKRQHNETAHRKNTERTDSERSTISQRWCKVPLLLRPPLRPPLTNEAAPIKTSLVRLSSTTSNRSVYL